MTRIYAVLAVLSVVLLAVTFVLGLSLDGASARVDETSQKWMRTHFLLGTTSALVVVLVQSIAATYFVGTSRWCKEVIETYGLDTQLAERSQRLKRRAFPWAVVSMLTIVGVIAAGAAGDPATARANTEMWNVIHFIAACCGATLIAATYLVVWNRIRENQAVIDAIVAQVREIRLAKGLEVA